MTQVPGVITESLVLQLEAEIAEFVSGLADRHGAAAASLAAIRAAAHNAALMHCTTQHGRTDRETEGTMVDSLRSNFRRHLILVRTHLAETGRA